MYIPTRYMGMPANMHVYRLKRKAFLVQEAFVSIASLVVIHHCVTTLLCLLAKRKNDVPLADYPFHSAQVGFGLA